MLAPVLARAAAASTWPVARVVGGTLLEEGSEGPVRAYPLDRLPALIPIRVANQRTLDAYLDQRRRYRAP